MSSAVVMQWVRLLWEKKKVAWFHREKTGSSFPDRRDRPGEDGPGMFPLEVRIIALREAGKKDQSLLESCW